MGCCVVQQGLIQLNKMERYSDCVQVSAPAGYPVVTAQLQHADCVVATLETFSVVLSKAYRDLKLSVTAAVCIDVQHES